MGRVDYSLSSFCHFLICFFFLIFCLAYFLSSSPLLFLFFALLHAYPTVPLSGPLFDFSLRYHTPSPRAFFIAPAKFFGYSGLFLLLLSKLGFQSSSLCLKPDCVHPFRHPRRKEESRKEEKESEEIQMKTRRGRDERGEGRCRRLPHPHVFFMSFDLFSFPVHSEKNLLLLGAGFVAGPCLDYLLRRPENRITVGKANTDVTVLASHTFPHFFTFSLTPSLNLSFSVLHLRNSMPHAGQGD